MKRPAYEQLKFYQNISELRRSVYQISRRFERSHPRLVSQLRDALRSAKQNIIEGYRKDTFGDYYRSIKISRGSLGEAAADLHDCFEDALITKEEYARIEQLIMQTDYMIDRYLDSIARLAREGKWHTRFPK